MDSNNRQVVVVTGASAGVGRATAVAFAGRGASVGLLARGSDGLEGARTEIESVGGRALAIPTDVSDADAVEEGARRVEEAEIVFDRAASTGSDLGLFAEEYDTANRSATSPRGQRTWPTSPPRSRSPSRETGEARRTA